MTATSAATCLIAIGSNLGERLDNMRAGVTGLAIAEGITIEAVSPLYETAPVGGPDNQGAYYNAALLASIERSAADTLALLHQIEANRERTRDVHWGPRTLDLDLLVHGDLVSDDTALEVPHPRMHLRRFVLVPVCDLAPDMVHPRLGMTMRALLGELPEEPGDLRIAATRWSNPDHKPDWT
jgi:2-amino-4-hydroxy-6-hydroxymethyldihydropteridine diphosphokinase